MDKTYYGDGKMPETNGEEVWCCSCLELTRFMPKRNMNNVTTTQSFRSRAVILMQFDIIHHISHKPSVSLLKMESFTSFYNRKTREIIGQPINPAFRADIDILYVNTRRARGDDGFGEDGFLTVYEGSYDGKEAIIKWIIDDESKQSETRQKALEKKIHIIADLDHDNIVKFFAASVLPAGCAIIMKYGGVHTLEDFFGNETLDLDLDLEKTIKYVLTIARAMVYIHALGIIHKDLKLGNLLILGDVILKLIDFGIAQKVDLVHGEVGSWVCTALEVLRRVPGDHKVDVYSYSISLWELLKRDNISWHTSFRRHAKEGRRLRLDGFYQISSHFWRDVGRRPSLDGILPDIGSLLERCWANEPGNRPEFREIEDILDGILEDI